MLIDFGLSKTLDHMQTSTEMSGSGSTRWCSPEILEGGSRDTASDVFAVSLTIYEVSISDQSKQPDH
jgi:serine/threonine protein kinase